uniref:PP-loop domain-containing protein n=1 Tax=uncultured organism TaxID=155900 RepID=M1QAI0_9ZZZZ|nr:PP-loop domain-containing protein [uncultured organism]
MQCSRCERTPVTYIRYSGEHLCQEHFKEYFEKKVFTEFRKQVDLGRGKKIAVAVSGGKDSLVALKMVKEIVEERRDSEVHGITIDEGIECYRPSSLEIAEAVYEKLDIEYDLVSFEEMFGLPLDDMLDYDIGNPCSVCGVLRRWIMNKLAKKADADLLATGLNLDDTSQSVLMNFCRGDMEKMARLSPHEEVKEGFVPRIAPLRKVPEKESYLYAHLSEMKVHEKECPYAETALRGLYRDVIGQLEDNTPGARYSILSSFDKVKPLLREEYDNGVELDECERCGEPTMSGRCKACTMIKRLEERTDRAYMHQS